MAERGVTATGLARAAGVTHTMLLHFFSGRVQSLRVDSLVKLARELRVNPAVFFERGEPVRVLGQVVAEDHVQVIDPAEYAPEWVYAFGKISGEEFAALDVATSGLAPTAQRGSVIFYEPSREPPSPKDDGHLCVCSLDDGELMVKTLRFTPDGRAYLAPVAPHLPPIRDREVISASRVRLVLPAELVERLSNDGEAVAKPSETLHESGKGGGRDRLN